MSQWWPMVPGYINGAQWQCNHNWPITSHISCKLNCNFYVCQKLHTTRSVYIMEKLLIFSQQIVNFLFVRRSFSIKSDKGGRLFNLLFYSLINQWGLRVTFIRMPYIGCNLNLLFLSLCIKYQASKTKLHETINWVKKKFVVATINKEKHSLRGNTLTWCNHNLKKTKQYWGYVC